ncbi:MAG: lipid IV(A) 3-deoxy-D-manno-octulosonic acid transferase [Gammaproteobacteria bacterium]|nr:lipid IV(A) 3-deoxy-D-manno-octulosonic acid transferase [Gammaproteobacteria bacterium]
MIWRAIYITLHLLALPLLLLRLWWRGRAEPLYRQDLAARFGRWDGAPEAAGVWVHAVSVGETVAAVPLLRGLEALAPSAPRILTVTTAAGRDRARELLGDSVHLSWLPFDLPFSIRAFLRRARPRLLVLIETELWPVLIHECQRFGVRVVLVNARLSERSAAGYRRLGGLTRDMLDGVDLIACQDSGSAQRFIALGARPERVTCPGNMKFDALLPGDLSVRMDRARERLGTDDGPLLIAASTHAGEEQRLLAACVPLLRRHPDWRLLIVPRHAHRFDAVWRLMEQSPLAAARLSAGEVPAGSRLLLGDVMGELIALYGLADVAFLGGSLVPHGGHNPIEPAWHGLPLFSGPHLANFTDVAQRFREACALEVVADADELARAMERVLGDDELWQQRSDAARSVVEANRGALGAILADIRAL